MSSEKERAKAKLALIEAEEEIRRRRAEKEREAGTTPNSRSAVQYADRIAGEFNEGLMSLLPDTISNNLRTVGVGVSDEEREQNPSGAMERGVRYMGMAAPMALGVPAWGARASQYTGVLKTFLDDVTKFALERPKAYFGGEAAGAFGAGAAGEMAKDQGPLVQAGAELAGGLTGGGLAAAAPRTLRGAQESVRANLTPFTEEGGMIRAARQMQARAGGREEEYAKALADMPAGVTPAQWIGDERLMAQEARLVADNPELANRVRGELQEARITAQSELQDAFGKPRSKQDWEAAVLERVTPEGTKIKRGMTDNMLDQAYRSFTPFYNKAKGHPISATAIDKGFASAVNDPDIIASGAERKAVRGWVKNQWTAYSKKVDDGLIDSDSLIRMRSKIRDERRKQSRRGNEERADLLGAAEAEITRRLERGLPPSVAEELKAVDSQYRKYKVVENAIFNAGDNALSPQDISRSIQTGGLTTNSQYARGTNKATQELRRLALSGRSTEEVLGQPQRAASFVRGLGPTEKQAVQADFMGVLFSRAKNSARDATEGGMSLISGKQLMKDLQDNTSTMRALGMNQEEVTRVRKMGETIQKMEKKPPAAVARLFEDGPASILELASALAGAKSGQRLAGEGMGSSLVIAQYMSNKARSTLANLTADEATRLMQDAATDKELYKALLTKTIVPKIKDRAQYLESWLLASAYEKTQ